MQSMQSSKSKSNSVPELLDYLAWRFMQDGWSLKKLHRSLMLSSAYQQRSDDNLRYETMDPDKRLLSKANRRRLDFESMRDTLSCWLRAIWTLPSRGVRSICSSRRGLLRTAQYAIEPRHRSTIIDP